MKFKNITNKKKNAGFSLSGIFWFIFILIVILGFGYHYKDNISVNFKNLLNKVQPCERPITYSIGNIDPKFGISESQLLSDIDKAGSTWGNSINKQLFAYSPTGRLKINLVYDYRQQASNDLKKLGIAISFDQNTYDTLKAKLESLQSEYEKKNAYLDTLVANYNATKKAYEKDVANSNSRGGASKQDYNSLEKRRIELNNQVALINQAQNSVNALVEPINSIVLIINKLVDSLNLQVDKYNGIGSSVGKEFTEGEYTSGVDGISINIYQFNDENELVRVLTHEMGHALGLDHSNNSKAIMYYLSEGANSELTADDIAALKDKCQVK